MYLFFVILMVVASVAMCFIVLIQNSKGGGLAAGFSSSNAIMGVRKTTDFLEKATWGLAIFLVLMSVLAAYSVPSSRAVQDAVLEQAQKEEQTNPYTLPAGTEAPKTDGTAAAPAQASPDKATPAQTTPAPKAEEPAPKQ
ncbi:MAG: preprotein translocase subunit SecG [Mediterranea sp.]|jgi:preprotein translocase subunit SecG|nr:preprotein translocase subunit SecG [Mediterranea sp.]